MSRIRLLDAHTVNKIAAGEVIERPASVVKELLENSIDALATRVEVDIAAGGTELIRIVDDGEGMTAEELPLAVTSHATSKVGSVDELERIHTLGFRGEALASIAAVSQMRFGSRPHDTPGGTELEVRAGRMGEIEQVGCPPGSCIEVRQLFGNTPVRRKFLRTTATEFGHISEQFARIALAHPRLHCTLTHNGQTVHELPATPDLGRRLELFYGSDLAERLIEVESDAGEVRLWGFVAHPSQSKSTRKGQYLFLNGRWIQDRSLQHALSEAYRGLLMTGRHPICFLFLEMPPELVDVNVHPTKSEVRFLDSQQLYRQLLSTLRTRFLGMDLESTISLPESSRRAPARTSDPERQHELQVELAGWAREQLQQWSPDAAPVLQPAGQFAPSSDSSVAVLEPEQAENLLAPSTDSAETPPPVAPQTAAASLPPAPRTAMQVHDCYLVVETEDGLTVIDQHALHERVLYEQLRERVLAGAVESQKLLVPETVELGRREAAALLERTELLAELGFAVESFGGETVLISQYPVMLRRANLPQLVRDVAEQLETNGERVSRRELIDSLLHMMACKAAIKAGQRLSPEEMESLLAQRHLCADAHHCPHGRPTALTLTRAELDRQFGRLG